MHLFSGHSSQTTPSATPNRPYSPSTPRRSIQLGPSTLPRRPGLAARTSSLSVASLASSTESLPGVARLPNGSSLRNELTATQGANAPDPVAVLESILGPLSKEDGANGVDHDAADARPSTVVENIDFGGLSLEDFANSASLSASAIQSNGTSHLSLVDDFEKEKDKFEDLHKSILECDEVLQSVETYLTSFQADLANVSSEIESLQNRSTTSTLR